MGKSRPAPGKPTVNAYGVRHQSVEVTVSRRAAADLLVERFAVNARRDGTITEYKTTITKVDAHTFIVTLKWEHRAHNKGAKGSDARRYVKTVFARTNYGYELDKLRDRWEPLRCLRPFCQCPSVVKEAA